MLIYHTCNTAGTRSNQTSIYHGRAYEHNDGFGIRRDDALDQFVLAAGQFEVLAVGAFPVEIVVQGANLTSVSTLLNCIADLARNGQSAT